MGWSNAMYVQLEEVIQNLTGTEIDFSAVNGRHVSRLEECLKICTGIDISGIRVYVFW